METILLNTSAFGQLTDEQFFDFCQQNRDLRMERTADGQIIIMTPTGGITGNLRISPNQQVDFLKKLYANELQFSARTLQIVKEIMVIEQNNIYTLRGKTGWGILGDANYGWFVGYVEKGENVYIFAANITTNQPEDSFAQARKTISLNILKELDILE